MSLTPYSSDLQQEFLEISEKLYQRDVARFQVQLHKLRQKALAAFTDTVYQFAGDGLNAVNAILEKTREMQEHITSERQGYVNRQQWLLEQRQQAIRHFCSSWQNK